MPEKFLEIALTPAVRRAQERCYGGSLRRAEDVPRDMLGPEEIAFIEARDSFYLASVSETAWPYLQHRGGAPGFLLCIGPASLAFADYKGNRQLLTTGNLAGNDRVALFLMDYRRRTRLKILGHGRTEDTGQRPDLLDRLATPATRGKIERLFVIDVVAFDWNCPQYITPRYTAAEVEEAVAPLKQRIAVLESRTG
jgi:uncharacterized protein